MKPSEDFFKRHEGKIDGVLGCYDRVVMNGTLTAIASGGDGEGAGLPRGLREAITKDARRLLEGLYQDPALTMPNHAGRPGEKCHLGRAKDVETLFGPITLRRNYFYCESTDEGRAPLDDALGLVNGYSPSIVRLANRAAARTGFAGASSDLAAMANVQLDGRQIQRLVNLAAPLVAAQRDQVRLARDLSAERIPVFLSKSMAPGCRWTAPNSLATRASNRTARRRPGKPNWAASSRRPNVTRKVIRYLTKNYALSAQSGRESRGSSWAFP